MFLDQQKTFDRVEWEYVDIVLENMNFGPNFRKWVQILYKDSQSAILTNGYVSEMFNLRARMPNGSAPVYY